MNTYTIQDVKNRLAANICERNVYANLPGDATVHVEPEEDYINELLAAANGEQNKLAHLWGNINSTYQRVVNEHAGGDPVELQAGLLACGACPVCAAFREEAEKVAANSVLVFSDDEDPESEAEATEQEPEAPITVERSKFPHFVVNKKKSEEEQEGQIRETSVLVEKPLSEMAAEAREELKQLEEQGITDKNRSRALLLATADYWRRESSEYWEQHFIRLSKPYEEWSTHKNTIIFSSVIPGDWGFVSARSAGRELEVEAILPESHSLKVGDSGLFLMYAASPHSPEMAVVSTESQVSLYKAATLDKNPPRELHRIGYYGGSILEMEKLEEAPGGVKYRMVILEKCRAGAFDLPEDDVTPIGIAPGIPVNTKNLERSVLDTISEPEIEHKHITEYLERKLPTFEHIDELLSAEEYPLFDALYGSAKDMDHGFIAVQGPPGTGKTYIGSKLIKELTDDGFSVGIVGPSHAVVENMMFACVEAGVQDSRMFRFTGKTQSKDAVWREAPNSELTSIFTYDRGGGFVFGGTAWDFASPNRIQYVDYLVVDEAGQFSVANLIACARTSERVILLGDPQQLPQVSVTEHPYPINTSALGWVIGDNATVDAEHGYFLDTTYRMSQQLCEPLSGLFYDGKLSAAPTNKNRSLAAGKDSSGYGMFREPGLYVCEVPNTGARVRSVVEAQVIEQAIRGFLGQVWNTGDTDNEGVTVTVDDVIVVAAYNAQVDTITEHLRLVGLIDEDGNGVRVGTVDKFQGQQAVVSIVSMAASNAGLSSRGADFLLSGNRLNVAVSRGKHAALVVASGELSRFVPNTSSEAEALSAYVGLMGSARRVDFEALASA